MLNRLRTSGAIVALTLLSSACRQTAAQADLRPPEERFAREFICLLQDSGSVAISALAAPELRALKGFAPNMDVLRGILTRSHAKLTLAHWNDVPRKDGIPKLIHIVYAVEGAGAPSEIELWIEGEPGHYLLNTISVGSPNPGGDG